MSGVFCKTRWVVKVIELSFEVKMISSFVRVAIGKVLVKVYFLVEPA